MSLFIFVCPGSSLLQLSASFGEQGSPLGLHGLLSVEAALAVDHRL